MAGKPIIGIGSTSGGLGGFVPQVNRTGYTSLRERKLFYSQREVGLLCLKQFAAVTGNFPWEQLWQKMLLLVSCSIP